MRARDRHRQASPPHPHTPSGRELFAGGARREPELQANSGKSDELVHPPPCLTLPLVGSKQGGSPEPLVHMHTARYLDKHQPWQTTVCSRTTYPAQAGSQGANGEAESDERKKFSGRKTWDRHQAWHEGRLQQWQLYF